MNEILSRFLPRIDFESYEDFFQNYKCIVPEDFNFAVDVADAWAAKNPDKQAIIRTDDDGTVKTYSFADIKRLSDKAANALVSLGVKKGDAVMLILRQRAEVWWIMCALMKIGAVCIPATYQLTSKDLEYRCNIAKVKLLIAVDDDDVLENISLALKTCKNPEKTAVVGDKIPCGFIDMNLETQKAGCVFNGVKTKTDDPMLVYFSSGTTGLPKMVMHNHALPLGHIVTAKYWQCAEDGRVHLTQTDSGWAKFAWGKIFGQWLCGASVGVYDTKKFSSAGILGAIQRLRPYSFCAPATVFRYLIKEDLNACDFSFIRTVCVAGEPLSPEVYHKFKEMTGLEIREGFGQSETSVMAASFKWLPVKPGSMGKPAPLFDLKLLDEEGNDCDEGIVGNMSITRAGENMYCQAPEKTQGAGDSAAATGTGFSASAGLFRGYWKDEQITNDCWKDGIYRTGDLAWKDDDGYLWFVGRNDDVIKCSGYRIGPFEVESALMEHPCVLECAVTAAPDPMRGQVVKATIVLARGYSASDELIRELQSHVKRVTAPYKYPRIIEFVRELPKTASGKIQRNVIRKKDSVNNQ